MLHLLGSLGATELDEPAGQDGVVSRRRAHNEIDISISKMRQARQSEILVSNFGVEAAVAASGIRVTESSSIAIAVRDISSYREGRRPVEGTR
jgi:hypothetical protein